MGEWTESIMIVGVRIGLLFACFGPSSVSGHIGSKEIADIAVVSHLLRSNVVAGPPQCFFLLFYSLFCGLSSI